jgi:hypothetical protein
MATRPKKRVRLSVQQTEIVGQFNDYAFEHPNLTFDQVAKKDLWKAFPKTPNGRKFRMACKKVFDRERE